MPVKTQKTQTPVVEITESPAPSINVTVEANDLTSLRLQQQAINARIKELKAAEPKMSALEVVIHRQTTSWESWIVRNVANRIKARVAAGQDRQEASDGVMAFFRNLADERIDNEDRPETQQTDEEETK